MARRQRCQRLGLPGIGRARPDTDAVLADRHARRAGPARPAVGQPAAPARHGARAPRGARLARRARRSQPQGPRRVRAHGRRGHRRGPARPAGEGRRRLRMPGHAREPAGAPPAGRPWHWLRSTHRGGAPGRGRDRQVRLGGLVERGRAGLVHGAGVGDPHLRRQPSSARLPQRHRRRRQADPRRGGLDRGMGRGSIRWVQPAPGNRGRGQWGRPPGGCVHRLRLRVRCRPAHPARSQRRLGRAGPDGTRRPASGRHRRRRDGDPDGCHPRHLHRSVGAGRTGRHRGLGGRGRSTA